MQEVELYFCQWISRRAEDLITVLRVTVSNIKLLIGSVKAGQDIRWLS